MNRSSHAPDAEEAPATQLEGVSEATRAALRSVPRANFPAIVATGDPTNPAVYTQTSKTVGQILDALQLKPGDRVLQVGAGVGYAASVCSRLCGSLRIAESSSAIAEATRERIQRAGCANVSMHVGEALLGWPEHAPYDAIYSLEKTLHEPPLTLLQQLRIGARLVFVRREGQAAVTIVCVTRTSQDEHTTLEVGTIDVALECRTAFASRGLGSLGIALLLRRTTAGATDPEWEVRRLATLPDADLYREVAALAGVPYASAGPLLDELDVSLHKAFPRHFLQHNNLLPISRRGDTVMVASTDAAIDLSIFADALPGTRPALYLVTPETLRRLWTHIEWKERQRVAAIADAPVAADAETPAEDAAEALPDAHVVAMLDTILRNAVEQRASDVHLERYEDAVRVRFRIDGDLLDVTGYEISLSQVAGLVNVIKIRSDLDISERRLPQGGRSTLRLDGVRYDLRIQTQPALHGEHVVIRILPQDTRLLTIEDLGFPVEIASRYRRLLDVANGLILVVGPTGSGKSTTLYAGLQILVSDATRKVITVEDPIEYSIRGIQQTQARPEIGFAFSTAMRAFVREDPDVILVGEIRDAETALEALRASQTGHLVLSTLHCNDTVDAVQRLIDLGMHPNSIAGELIAVLAQRLVRRNCIGCRVPVPPDPAILSELFPHGPPSDFSCQRGVGCEKCGGLGTIGRIGVVEFLPTGPEIRAGIARRATVDDLRVIALRTDILTLRAHALRLVREGTIPLSEIPTILSPERMGEGG